MLDIKFVREIRKCKQKYQKQIPGQQTGTGRQGYRTGQRKP
mgnify:CR=1 FL=1